MQARGSKHAAYMSKGILWIFFLIPVTACQEQTPKAESKDWLDNCHLINVLSELLLSSFSAITSMTLPIESKQELTEKY